MSIWRSSFHKLFVAVISVCIFMSGSARGQLSPNVGILERVSVASDGTEGNSGSGGTSISADGRYVAFRSNATNLVNGDTNEYFDIFVHDRVTSETRKMSVSSDGTHANGHSMNFCISPDGRFVAFQSSADNLVSGDTNGYYDIFVHDRITAETNRVSVASDGTQGNSPSSLGTYSCISGDGRYVTFGSTATNLVSEDTNQVGDVFVHDQATGQTSRVSVANNGSQGNETSRYATISIDGRYVAFLSTASNLVDGDTNEYQDAFVYDQVTGETSRVSISSDGIQGNGHVNGVTSISADGRYVAFISFATNLVYGDTNGYSDVFIHDRAEEVTTRVSIATDGTQTDANSYDPDISGDGRYVTFSSPASTPVSGDTNESDDVFVHDLSTGETHRVSVASDGTQGNHVSWLASISADGRYIAFTSYASNLLEGDLNGESDVFVLDRGGEADSDGDGLYDIWEIDGVDTDGDGIIDIDLPAMGADPNKKDIFIEVDWMADAEHSHKPNPLAIQKIVQAFANSPVDGVGINLHVDAGPGSIDYVTGEAWGDRSGGNALPHQAVLGQNTNFLDDINTIIEGHFSPERSQVFHYAIFAHQFTRDGENRCSSGVSLGNGYQVFIVTLGCFENRIGSINEQAGTFMHELGHNLGLQHGGDEAINYKPNYLSIMNYSFQMGGLIIDGKDGYFDYSRFNLPYLDESLLSEPNGLNANQEIDDYGTKFHITFPFLCIPDWQYNLSFTIAQAANGPINWDCGVGINDNPVQVDTNNDGEVTILRSHNDWANLDFTAGEIGSPGASAVIEIPPEAIGLIHDEITPEEDALIPRMLVFIYLPMTIDD